MHPRLARLQQYPFQRLAALLKGVQPDAAFSPINVSIGEPKHATPEFIKRALVDNLDGLAGYPPTLGTERLRTAIAGWITRRYALPALDPTRQVLPLNGSREGLFAIAQAVVDDTRPGARVVMPNPFYQIYEGATLLAGAEPEFINTLPGDGYRLDFEQLPASVWAQTQLIYVCSPGNPTGSVMRMQDWERLFALSDRHGFVIASDESSSQLSYDEADPPLGGLQAAHRLGRHAYPRLVCFGSLSKRSNVPGLRSGFVAGDAALLEKFLLFRTYVGNAMSLTVQAASQAAWEDEAHVRDNRRLYREKFEAALATLRDVVPVSLPQGGFYLWLPTPGDDTGFAQRLYQKYNVMVLPGSYLAREARGINPGRGFVRAALVSAPAECREAVQRIRAFLTHHA